VNPGTVGNAYGIAFTYSGQLPNASNPVSTRCTAEDNVIKNIPVWECLDTHNGNLITFANNILENCKIGIHAGSVDGTDEVVRHATIVGNVLVAGSAQHQHFGIVVAGSSTNYAYNVVVSGNALDGYGADGYTNNGAIHAYYTGGVSISNNTITHAAEAGIVLWHHNADFNVTGNLIELEIWSGTPYAIRAHGGQNFGMIVANRVHGLVIDTAGDPGVTVSENY
jgi:hypothetical protein